MLNRRSFLTPTASHLPSPAGYWLHVNRRAMACLFEVTLPLSEQAGIAAANEALDEIERLEQQLSIFRESSEISSINRAAAARAVPVERSLFDLLRLCQKLSHETESAFDITAGPLTRCWGFFQRDGRIPSMDEIESTRACVGSEKLLLNREAHTIRFARDGVEINLGSIGKGYALDRVGTMMRRRLAAALLCAGSSSILAIGSGDHGHTGWSIGVRHPRDKERRLATLRLRDCAMSTSGAEEQFFELDGQRYGHIIDPRTGRPADSVTSVSVVAQSAAISDALATAFYVGGRELAESYCATHRDVLAIMVLNNSETPLVIGSNRGCKIESIA
jgi:FAD:protein FMN transferase